MEGDEPAYIDLYYNDMHCLKVTFETLAQGSERIEPWDTVESSSSFLSSCNPFQTICQAVFLIYNNMHKNAK